jgi:hypothetical protein
MRQLPSCPIPVHTPPVFAQLRRLVAECGPAGDPCQSFQLVADRETMLADFELPHSLGVIGVAHLEHADRAPDLRFDLDVAHEDHVVEKEGEVGERLRSGAERARLARDQRGCAAGADRAGERPGEGGKALRLARGEHELAESVDCDAAERAVGAAPTPSPARRSRSEWAARPRSPRDSSS